MRHSLPRPLVLATGVFDLLHAEHVALLQMAREQGAYLVVGINSDASARRVKGPGRPIIPQQQRLQLLSALRCVDGVIVFDFDTPRELVLELQPDVLVKGHDYGDKLVVGREEVEAWGGRVYIAPTRGRIHTTDIIDRIKDLL